MPAELIELKYFAVLSLLLTLLAWLVQKGKLSHFAAGMWFFTTLPLQFFAFLLVGINVILEPTIDPAAYEYLLHELNYPRNELIAFFPEEIPDCAQDVSLWHNYPFLQGGERFTLAFTADDAYIDAEIDRFAAEAKWTGSNAEADRLNNEVSWNTFDELDESGYYLPDDYTIYLLYSRPYRDSGDHIWNHGETCVVVISDEKNKILYEMNDW